MNTLTNTARLNKYRAGLLMGTALVMLTFAPTAHATNATWQASPGSNNWNTGSNWVGGTAPVNTGDSATFSVSSVTNPTLSSNVTISALTVTQGPYTITAPTGTTFTDNGTYSNPDVHLLTFATSGTGSLVFSGSASLGNNANGNSAAVAINTTGTGSVTISGTSSLNNSTDSIGSGTSLIITGTGSGGTASVTSAGTIDISGTTGTTIGSLNGTGGTLTLGAENLSVGANNTNDSYAGAIGGTGGSLTKTGTGTQILTGANTYTGGTTISGGTLQGTTTSLQGNILDNAAMTFSQGASGTYSGTLSGTGTLTDTGAGTVTLSGTNTYSGGTLITGGGTVSIAAQSNLGSNISANTISLTGGTLFTSGAVTTAQNVALGTGTNVINNGGHNDTFSGIVSDGGGGRSLTATGTGTLTLSNVNTYSGGTNINGGTVSVGAQSGLGSNVAGNTIAFTGGTLLTTGAVASAQNVVLNAGTDTINTGTFSDSLSGTVSGSGALTKTGAGTLTLFNANTYSGGTNINGGTISIDAQNNLGSNAASNTIALAGGTLLTTGPVTTAQNVTLGAGADTIDTNGSNDTFSGVISSTGALLKAGAGTLTLSGVNTYSGGTTVLAGTLQGTTSSIESTISNAGTVAFNQTTTGIYSGTIYGTGALTMTGTGGDVILNGANTYTGLTTVNSGTLTVGDSSNPTASIGGSATVASGGTLRGHGTVYGNVTNTGTVMPGASIGTLTVNGNYTQPTSGTLAIEVAPGAADRLAVGGTAGIAGTLALSPDAGITPYSRYTILTAGTGVFGTFGTVTDSGSTPFATSYTANSVILTSLPAQSFLSVAANNGEGTNARVAAAALDAAYPAAASSSNPTFYNDLNNIYFASSAQQASAFNQLTGEMHADLGTIGLENLTSFNQIILGRLDERQGLRPEQTANNGMPGMFQVAMADVDTAGPLYGPEPSAGGNAPITNDVISPWIRGYGVFGNAGGTFGTSEYGYSTGGVVAGADVKVTDTTLVGGAVAYDHTDYGSDALNDNGNIDAYHIVLYGTQKVDLPVVNSVLFDATAGYAYTQYQDQRVIPIPGVTSIASSNHYGNDYSVSGGVSKPLYANGPLGQITVLPRAGIEYDDIEQSAYAESGAGPLGLNTNSTSLNALRSIVGAKAAETFHTTGGTGLTPELRASWLHDFQQVASPTTVSFQGASTIPFEINGVNVGKDAAIVGTGLTAAFQHGVNAFVDYDATVRSNELDHTISMGVRYTW